MPIITKYYKPNHVEDAYERLCVEKNSVLIGGGTYIRLGSKRISTAIDLSNANLDYINETEKNIEIGAMVSLGEIEGSDIIKKSFGDYFTYSVRNVVGVSFRNVATIGATVYSRYGFSDILTALLALNVNVKLFEQGIMPLEKYLSEGSFKKDILESILIDKNMKRAVFKDMRNSSSDYAILNLAVSKDDERYRIAVGARPGRASLAQETMNFLSGKDLTADVIQEACNTLEDEVTFGTNRRGSEHYRRQISKVLLKRALMEVSDENKTNA